jgi:hypothetical protein
MPTGRSDDAGVIGDKERTGSLTAPSHAPGKRFLAARDRRPRTVSKAVLLPCRDCKPALRAREIADIRQTTGNRS